MGYGGEKLVGHNKIPVARPALLSVVLLKPRKPWITSPRLHALRSVVSIPNSGKATTLLYVVNANMLFSIIPPPQSPIVCSKDTSENVGVR